MGKRQYYINLIGNDDPFVIDPLIGHRLNKTSQQSKFAQALLKNIDIVLKRDKTYVKRLKKHYKIFRADIDNKY